MKSVQNFSSLRSEWKQGWKDKVLRLDQPLDDAGLFNIVCWNWSPIMLGHSGLRHRWCIPSLRWLPKSGTCIEMWCLFEEDSKQAKKMTSMLPLACIMVLLQLRVGATVCVKSNRASWVIEGPQKTTMDGRTWVGTHLSSHVVGRIFLVHLNTPTVIVWTIGLRVLWKSTARKVPHLSTIPSWGGLISLLMISGLRPWI